MTDANKNTSNEIRVNLDYPTEKQPHFVILDLRFSSLYGSDATFYLLLLSRSLKDQGLFEK